MYKACECQYLFSMYCLCLVMVICHFAIFEDGGELWSCVVDGILIC